MARVLHLLDSEAEPRRRVDDDALHQRVEVGRHARQNRRTQLAAVAIAVQLPVGRVVDAPARRVRIGEQRLHLCVG